MSPRPLIIDCDPGVDDAIALLLAFASPDVLHLLAVTTVAGNVPVTVGTRNALSIREIAGRPEVPVFAGAATPLDRALRTAEHVFGPDGLCGLNLAEPVGKIGDGHAADALVALLERAPEPVTLALLGPQTNLALALARKPAIVDAISEIVFMGGCAGPGNVTPHAEFNIFVDPEAAAKVLASGIALTMIGLDLTRQARVTAERVRAIGDIGSPAADLAARMLAPYARRGGRLGEPLHDACVVAYLIAPDLFECGRVSVAVECADPETLGRTTVRAVSDDARGGLLFPTRVQAEDLFRLLIDRLAQA